MAHWRLRGMKRAKGTYFLLETGRNETRRSLSLGFLTEGEANTALENLNLEERRTEGTPAYGRLFALHEKDPRPRSGCY